MIEAVIFDVDGTAVDSVDLHAKAWQVAFEKFEKKVSFEAIRRPKKMNGMSIKKSPDRGSHRSRHFVRRVEQSKPHPDIFAAALNKFGDIALDKLL